MGRALPRHVVSWLAALVTALVARPGAAWIENHVLGDEVRIDVGRNGRAVVAHRLVVKTNGSVRLRSFFVDGVSDDAVPTGEAHAIPERDALSSSLENAVPLVVTRAVSSTSGPLRLELKVDDRKGLRRGTYVFAFGYTTDLRAQGAIEADGAMLRVTWQGPEYPDGFDNARAAFVFPAAATAPKVARAPEDPDLSSTFLDTVARSAEHDELRLLRTYARERERITWSVRVDRRALDVDVGAAPASPATTDVPGALGLDGPPPRGVFALDRRRLSFFAGLALVVALLVALRRREVAARPGLLVRPLVPVPTWLAAPAAGLAFAAGVAVQVATHGKTTAGAVAVAAAALLVAHGGGIRAETVVRGPGTWLSLTEREGLGTPPRPREGWFDASSRPGRWGFGFCLATHAVATAWVWRHHWLAGLHLALDAVFWLALCTTGRVSAMPPDMAVEPARWLRRFVRRLRRHPDVRRRTEGLRIVPRVRIPTGEVDADELRLLVLPRCPPRGFRGVEVALVYASGFGARVAMPEVLLRVDEESPAHVALASVASSARVVPGRRREERVFVFRPRLPTVRMTVALVVALLVRIDDVPREAPRRRRPSRARRVSTADATTTPAVPSTATA